MARPSLGIVSHGLPPGDTGYQIILEELLRDLPSEEVILAGVGFKRWGNRRQLPVPIPRLPVRKTESLFGNLVLGGMRSLAGFPHTFPPVRRVMATLDPMIGFAARWARTVGAELWIYGIDLHADEFWGTRRFASVMRHWRREALGQAQRSFALSPVMAEWMRKEGARGPVDVLPPLVTVDPAPPARTSPPSLLFVGWVYTSNARPLGWIEAAAAAHPGLELRLATHTSCDVVRQLGLHPERWKISSLDPSQVRMAVAGADWTIAALDPGHPRRSALQVAWPTKLREYLGTGRPVLCVSAPDYALAQIASNQDWALVATNPSEVAGALALSQLESGADYSRRCASAVQFATEKMNNATLGAAFRDAILA